MRKFLTLCFFGLFGFCVSAHAGDLVVIEGALLTHDSAAGVVYAKECDRCEATRLSVDANTVVLVDEKPYPFTSKTNLSAPSDTAYDNKTMVVQYFRPLKIERD